ncbi:2'-5' RNA ligase family protein [Bacillus sp. AK031]
MYWVAAIFDSNTEQTIKGIWNELCEESISFFADEISNGRPHLTLASYSSLDKEVYIEGMKDFYKDKRAIDICFNTLGTFLNYGTLFFSPTMTNELFDLHQSHHHYFKAFNHTANSLYLPGKWIPHCTLANNLEPERMSEAFTFCLESNHTITGRIKEIALMEEKRWTRRTFGSTSYFFNYTKRGGRVMKKTIVFIVSFFIVYTAVQLISGMFLTLTYTPDIEKLWQGSSITSVEQSSSFSLYIILFLSAGIAFLITKLYSKLVR